MKAYLTAASIQLLQNGLQTPGYPLAITGSQIGSAVNFTPNDNMMTAQGSVLLDSRYDGTSVKGVSIIMHEVIYMVRLNQNYEFAQVGNILIYLNNTPFLWLVSEVPLPKQKIDPVAHFVGDDYFFPCVFRFPYISKIISFDYVTNGWYAKFKSFATNAGLIVPEQNVTDQSVIEQCNAWYGDNKPIIPFRIDSEWLAAPLMFPLGNNFGFIDSGKTKAGQ